MQSYTEKINRLTARLESVDTKITEYQSQRETIVQEIQNLLTGTHSSARTIPVRTRPTVPLGDQIISFLQANKSGDVKEIAGHLSVKPSQAGLSLHHLVRKGRVSKAGDDKFYPVEGV